MHGPAQNFAGCDILVALHAIRSSDAILRFKQDFPHRPVLVVLTGTDYFQPGDLRPTLDRSLRVADRVIVLQNHLASQLPVEVKPKTRVIFQSFTPPTIQPVPDREIFEVCVLGHLRAVKDPLLAARAARLLANESRIRITQVGGALETVQAELATAECQNNPRYQWLGELARTDAVRVLARCQVLVQSSLAEGGPSAVSEAVALGIPVLSTPTSGVVGLLGPDHPGYFPFGDAVALAELLARCEAEPDFWDRLRQSGDKVQTLVRPEAEREAWRRLLDEPGLLP